MIKFKDTAKDVQDIIRLKCAQKYIKRCPSCNGEHCELSNTHTPYYSIQCECGLSFDDQQGGKTDDMKGHAESALRVVLTWNELPRRRF